MSSKKISITAGSTDITPENKCSSCKGSTCCTYITQEIDPPRTKKDFSLLLWQVSHEGIHICREKPTWYLVAEGRCTHLLPDGRCAIYENRPHICRDHSNDCCEHDGPRQDGFDLYFFDYDSLLKYCRKKFKNWDGKKSGKKDKKKKH